MGLSVEFDIGEKVWETLSKHAEFLKLPTLMPAGPLLDLYGEDIKSRAYITYNRDMQEMMLRPDFTLAVALTHLNRDIKTALYAYHGTVWRQQEMGSDRASEYLQYGVECFATESTVKDDISLFLRVKTALDSSRVSPLNVSLSDASLLRSIILQLSLSKTKKNALLRHIWRPQRFQKLLDRFLKDTPQKEEQNPYIVNENWENTLKVIPAIGKRSLENVKERLALLKEEHYEKPLPLKEYNAVCDLLAIKDSLPNALRKFQTLAKLFPTLKNHLKQWEERCTLLEASHVNLDEIKFEAENSLTSMEYYDGFLFSFKGEGAQPIAIGGRYNRLMLALGAKEPVFAAGAIIRPDLLSKELEKQKV